MLSKLFPWFFKKQPEVEKPKAQTWYATCQCGYNVYYNPMKVNLNSGLTNVEVDLTEKKVVVLRCNACYKTGDYVFPDKFKNLNP